MSKEEVNLDSCKKGEDTTCSPPDTDRFLGHRGSYFLHVDGLFREQIKGE